MYITVGISAAFASVAASVALCERPRRRLEIRAVVQMPFANEGNKRERERAGKRKAEMLVYPCISLLKNTRDYY